MIKRRPLLKISYIAIILNLFITFSYAQDEAARILKRETAVFMLHLADDLIAISKMDDSLERANMQQRQKILQQTPFFNKINGFLHEHESEYLAIRKRALSKFAAPPKQLLELPYKPIEAGDELLSFYGSPEIASLVLVRALGPMDVGMLVTNLFRPQIKEFQGQDDIKQITLSQLFGAKFYVKKLSNYEWKIWSVNRLFVLSFSWNIETGVMRNFNYVPPDAKAIDRIVFPPFMKPSTPNDSLLLKRSEYQWNAYNSLKVDDLASYTITHELGGLLRLFFEENKQSYLQLRTQLLRGRSKPIAVPSSYQVRYEGDDVKNIQEQLTSLNPFNLEPEDLTNNLYTFLKTSQDYHIAKPEINKMQYNAVIGFQHRAAPSDLDNVWKIQAEGYAEIIEYDWNIATGEISAITLWEK